MRRLMLALVLFVGFGAIACADQVKICAEPEYLIDFPDCPGCDTPLPRALPVARFKFNQAEVAKLKNITAVEFEMVMQGGDTAPGEFDYDKLSLGLGTIDTGLKLNGFPSGTEKAQALAWNSNNPAWPSQAKLGEILADIKDDGLIDASILDVTPNDNKINLYSAFQAKLCIWGEVPGTTSEPEPGTPEPASILLWSAAGIFAMRRRWAKR